MSLNLLELDPSVLVGVGLVRIGVRFGQLATDFRGTRPGPGSMLPSSECTRNAGPEGSHVAFATPGLFVLAIVG